MRVDVHVKTVKISFVLLPGLFCSTCGNPGYPGLHPTEVTTDDLSLWPSVPYLGAVLLALCLFRCQSGVLNRPPAQSQPVTPDGTASPITPGDVNLVDLQSPPLSPTVSLERLDESDPTFRESF